MGVIDEVIIEISALIRSSLAPSEQSKYNDLIKTLEGHLNTYEDRLLSQREDIANLNKIIIDKDKKLGWANTQLDLQLNEIKRKEKLLKNISDLMIDQTKDI